MLMSYSCVVSVCLIFSGVGPFLRMSVEFTMLVIRNEYVALLQGSKMSAG